MALDTIKYYLASSLKTGITVDDASWSAEFPILDETDKYLWIRKDVQEYDEYIYGTPYNVGINIERPSTTFLNEMYNDNRNFVYNAYITLADGTILNFSNEELSSAGVSIEEAVSEESRLELGSAIINKCTLTVRNFDGIYGIYDFYDAKVILSIGLEINGEIEAFQKGVYYINEQNFNNALLVLTGLDSMSLFERPYTESLLTYPATIQEIIEDACSVCGVEFNGVDFLNSQLLIEKQPTIQGLTFRDVIAWAAQCCACNARLNNVNQLILKYYDFAFLNSISDKLLESWNGVVKLTTEGEEILQTEDGEDIILDVAGLNIFNSLYSINTAFNDTTITGVRIRIENPEYIEDVNEPILEYTSGTDSYEIVIENNSLISPDTAQQIVDSVGSALIGATYRKANFTHISDPVATAGDVAIIYDGHGNKYKVLVSSTTFTAGARQNTISAGATPPRIPSQTQKYLPFVRVTQDGAERITESGDTRTGKYLVQANNNRNLRAVAPTSEYKSIRRYSNRTKQYIHTLQDLAPKFESMGGLYETDVQSQSSGLIHVLHNKPNMNDSDIQLVISATGVQISSNATSANPKWYGFMMDGNLVANILEAYGVSADWITTGALRVIDNNGRVMFIADTGAKQFMWDTDYSRLDEHGALHLTDQGGYSSISPLTIQSYDLESGNLTWEVGLKSNGVSIHNVVEDSHFDVTADAISMNKADPETDSYKTIFSIRESEDSSGLVINGKSLEEWIQGS